MKITKTEVTHMELLTPRCLIRSFTEADLKAFMAYRNNLSWMKYQGFKGLTKEEYRLRLLSKLTFADGKQLAVTDRTTEKLLGDIYLQIEGDSCWLGYTIAPEYARQGYAFEAVEALILYLKSLGIKTIQAGVLPENQPSIQLLKKMGFIYTAQENEDDIYRLTL